MSDTFPYGYSPFGGETLSKGKTDVDGSADDEVGLMFLPLFYLPAISLSVSLLFISHACSTCAQKCCLTNSTTIVYGRISYVAKTACFPFSYTSIVIS